MLRFHGGFNRLREFLDETFIGIDSLVIAPGLLVQPGRGQTCFAAYRRIFFVTGNPFEFTRRAYRLSILAVEHGEFAGHIRLKFVSWISLSPGFQNADSLGPVFERDISGCGIILGRDIDG